MHHPKPTLCAALAALSLWPLLTARSGAADALHVDLGGGAALELVEIAPGEFLQGSKEGDPGHQADENQRLVKLTKKFYLGKYPVTNSQFECFAKETNYKTEAEKGSSGGYGWTLQGLVQRKGFSWRNPGFPQTDLHPVTLVTYNDAKAFLAWLMRKSGREFQLPSEAQWEYACRAGTKTAWPNGDDPAASDGLVWNKFTAATGDMPVGQKPLNAWGLGDMLGNVWEWCEDWYGPYEPGPVTDPLQTNANLSDKPRRVLRGGSFMRERLDCRSAARYRNDPASRNPDNGFRVMTFAAEANAAIPASAPAKQPAPATPPVNVELPDRAKSGQVRDGAQLRVVQADVFLPVAAGGIVVFIIVSGVIMMIIRSLTGGSSTPGISGSRRVFTRIADDGFWLTGENLSAGTPMFCRYQTGGAEQATEIVYEPGPDGHFVYTGQRPSNVTVVIAGQNASSAGQFMRNVIPPRYSSSTYVPATTVYEDVTPPPAPPRNPPAY